MRKRPMPPWFDRLREDRLHRLGYWPEINYGACPYYRQVGDKLCSFGCHEEPVCYTGQTRGSGWPPYRTRELMARLLRSRSNGPFSTWRLRDVT